MSQLLDSPRLWFIGVGSNNSPECANGTSQLIDSSRNARGNLWGFHDVENEKTRYQSKNMRRFSNSGWTLRMDRSS